MKIQAFGIIAVSPGKYIPTVRTIVLPSSSLSGSRKKDIFLGLLCPEEEGTMLFRYVSNWRVSQNSGCTYRRRLVYSESPCILIL
jgi:hypothetical protein